jgi:hypothetical protein
MEALMELAPIGHNNPPDPIDLITATHESIRLEAENWLDGQPVENEAQMLHVDQILKAMKSARKEIDTARDAATGPLHVAWKTEIARWKPTQDDYDLIIAGLVRAQDPFKRKLAAEKEAARAAAEKEAWEKTRAAQEAARLADASNIEATRAAQQAMADAEAAQRAAQAAGKDTVKGMRAYTTRTITDGTACARWIWSNDRDALLAWMQAYVDRSASLPDGVTETTEKRAV